MAIYDDLVSDVSGILSQAWDIRDGQVVPATEDITIAGGGVNLEATMLYADLADSTELARWDRRVAARIYKSFLICCTKLIIARGGYVRSFDGDRVMGVFIGDSKNSNAAKCALNIKYVFDNIIVPKLKAKYDAINNGTYSLGYCVGIDTSEVLVVRSGIRNNNDLLWVGRAPNIAAKLSAIRNPPYHSYITVDVYNLLNVGSKYNADQTQEMWEKDGQVGGISLYCSTWHWKP